MTERLGVDTVVRQNNSERKDCAEVFRSLTCPILILCSENDKLTPVADHREMLRVAPHARLIVVERSGYMTPIENPKRLRRLVDYLIVDEAFDGINLKGEQLA
jgi:pimeloyl-ACP methyl ester carboxylesterase